MRKKVINKKLPIILLILVAAYYTLPWMAINLVVMFGPKPPIPEIKYGEFPFRLVYEIDGEQKIVEDVIVCEYDGIGMNEGSGKYIKWKSYLKSNRKEEIVLLSLGIGKKIIYPAGNPRYYMGDLGENRAYNPLFPNAIMTRLNGAGLIDSNELQEMYNIKLISLEESPPIENTFK